MPRALAALCAAALAAGCAGSRGAVPDGLDLRWGAHPGKPSAELPPVPAGVRLASFDAERDSAACGGLLEPAWCVQLTARVRDETGRPAAGVPVLFALDRRSGSGRILPAALADEAVLTDERGAARTLLVSGDRPERCRALASCGPVTLAAEVGFERSRPPDFTVSLGPASTWTSTTPPGC